MGKVRKILVKMVTIVILSLLIVPLFSALLITLPSIQRKLTDELSTLLSDGLGSKVEIGRITLWPLYSVSIDDFLVEDFSGDTILRVKNVTTRITEVSQTSLRLAATDVTGAEFHLKQDSNLVMNVTKIVEHLTPEVKGEDFHLFISSINVEDSQFTLLLHNRFYPEQGMDYGDMEFNDLKGKLTAFNVVGTRVTSTMKSISGVEKGGGVVDAINGELLVNTGIVTLSDTDISVGESCVKLKKMTLSAPDWTYYTNFIEQVDMDGELESQYVRMEDIAPFAPEVGEMTLIGEDVSVKVKGRVNNLFVDVKTMDFGEGSVLRGTAHMEGLPDYLTSYYDIVVDSLSTNAADINYALESLLQPTLPEDVVGLLARSPELGVNGFVEGRIDSMHIKSELISALGDAEVDVAINTVDEVQKMDIKVRTHQYEVGRLLEVDRMGAAALWADIAVATPLNGITAPQIELDGGISQLNYNGYPYTQLHFNAAMDMQNYHGTITSKDPNIEFDLWVDVTPAQGDTSKKSFEELLTMGHYQSVLDLKYCNLHALNINRRDTISQISGVLYGDITGASVEHLNGNVRIANSSYKAMSAPLECDLMSLEIKSARGGSTINFDSPFATAAYNSQSSYGDVVQLVQNSLRSYLPALYSGGKTTSFDSEEGAVSTLSVSLNNMEGVLQNVDAQIFISDNTRLEVNIDPYTQQLSGSLTSNYIERGALLAIDLDAGFNTVSDSLSVWGDASQLYVGVALFNQFALRSSALNNDIKTRVEYHDTESERAGEINLDAQIFKDGRSSYGANIRFNPSFIAQDGVQWGISSKDITLDNRGVFINDFNIKSGQQSLYVDGVLGRSVKDLLNVELHDFDLSVITQLTKAIGYDIDGVTSGYATVNSALGSSQIDANIKLDKVTVNGIPTPALEMRAAWNQTLNRAVLTMYERPGDGSAIDQSKSLINGYYIPSSAEYYAKIDIDSIHLGVIDPLLVEVLNSSSGYAKADLELRGARRELSLAGVIEVENLSTNVDFTNVTYRAPKATLNVENSRFTARDVTIYDPRGGESGMNLTFDISQINNVEYSVRLTPRNMMVLNTTEKENELFYGTIFASGVGTITGDKRGVKMDFAAKTEPNSIFNMPLSSKVDAYSAEFIRFVESAQDGGDQRIASRRAAFEQRQQLNTNANANVEIALSLEVTPDAAVQIVIDPTVGDIIRAKGDGRMNISINPNTNLFEMYGDYTISEGNYLFTLQNIVNKRFVIDAGSTIQWTGDPLDALLNINAVYKLKTSLQPLLGDVSADGDIARSVPVDCVINLSNRLMQPDVTFNIELPDSDAEQQTLLANILNDQEVISRQFFYLMIANSFIPENSTNSISSLGTTSTAAATGFELLTNQLSNWLSSSNYNIILRYRPESELSGDEVDFGFSTGWIDNRLLVELEGNYVNEYKGGVNDVSNLFGEAYITWLIDRSGALKLRGFSQTIDRFDENQGLQETGVGIYYTESFNNFEDLKQRVKERFSFRARRKSKAAESDTTNNEETVSEPQ